MSDTDEIEQLREQKREALLGSPDESSAVETPDEPIGVGGSDELAATLDAAVAKVDVDENQQLAAEYQVRGVPTIVVFSGGDVVERMTGAPDRDSLERLVEEHGG